jgi:hypothetical protein
MYSVRLIVCDDSGSDPLLTTIFSSDVSLDDFTPIKAVSTFCKRCSIIFNIWGIDTRRWVLGVVLFGVATELETDVVAGVGVVGCTPARLLFMDANEPLIL